jgi:hypothetical protein
MEGGTYARAQQAGFSKAQASFFSNLGADTRNEAVELVRKEIDTIFLHRSLRYRIGIRLRNLADKLQGNQK